MNKQQFISYMDAPEKMSGMDASLLSGIIKQYPYFQTAHLLFAKSLHNVQSINYNNQLKTTAVYASDRKVLYQLITNKKEKVQSANSIVIAEKPSIAVIAQEVIQEEVAEKNIDIKVSESFPLVDSTAIAVKEIVKEEVLEKELIEKIQEELQEVSETETIETITKNEEAELEKEFLENAAISIYSEKTLHELPVIETPEAKKEEEQKPVEVNSVQEPNSFTDWLKNISTYNNDIYKTSNTSENSTQKETQTPKTGKLSDFELIDKFISEEPKISKPKTEFYNPINMAKQSVAEDISFVSETLAKIYELQGNYSKALASYETLRLKYPEKRLYFAAQIKHLKKKLT